MKKSDSFDFVKSVYESEKQNLPEALSKEKMLSKLQEIPQEKKKANIVPIRRIAAIAAAFIVIICAVFAGNEMIGKGPVVNNNGDEVTEMTVESAEKYKKIEDYFLERYSEYKKDAVYGYADDFVDFIYNGASADKNSLSATGAPEATMPESAMTTAASSSVTSAAPDSVTSTPHGQTNVQVANVNEADVIKNDGKHIYILSDSFKDNLHDNDVVYIIRGSDLEKVAAINLCQEENTAFSGREIYVEDNKLFVIGEKATVKVAESQKEDNTLYYGSGSAVTTAVDLANDTRYFTTYCLAEAPEYSTVILTYDLSDIDSPELIYEKTQSGSYQSSRMINGTIYTVTTYNVRFGDKDKKTVKKDCIPKIDGKRIDAESIDITENSKEKMKSYTVVSASDTEAEDMKGAAYAYLGYCKDIYCTTDTLYFTYEEYTDLDYTVINAVSLSKDAISFTAKGKVEGRFNNQFSMDEHKGYFRVATTGYNYFDFKNTSNIYVLNDKLEIVGRLENMADNEEVKSVRFMGDTAYVVTFEQTDPLFIVDLSNPEKPEVEGYVKLPGYSSYLHPVGKDYLVGVGYGGTEDSVDRTTLKVTLFDVSVPENPEVASNFEVCEAGSEITDCNNHKAFLYYSEKNLIGIPVRKYNYSETGFREVFSYAVLEVKDGELELKNGYVHKQPEGVTLGSLFRGTYIADTLYTISDNSVCAFDIDSGEMLKMTSLR